MKRVLTATCFAMACAVGLSAQQTTGTSGATDPQGGQGRGPRTVTGCLRAGDTAGTYMLTDIQMSSAATTGTTTGGGTTTTAPPPPPPPVTTTGGQRGQMPTSVMLATTDSSIDLKPHVGHKIEVTGTMAGARGGNATTGGTTGGTTTTGGGTTATGGGTTGESGQARPAMRTMNVTSVRMISESCS